MRGHAEEGCCGASGDSGVEEEETLQRLHEKKKKSVFDLIPFFRGLVGCEGDGRARQAGALVVWS